MKQCFIVPVAIDNEKGGRWAMKGNSDDRKPLILKIFYLMTIQTFHSILSGASAGTLTKKRCMKKRCCNFYGILNGNLKHIKNSNHLNQKRENCSSYIIFDRANIFHDIRLYIENELFILLYHNVDEQKYRHILDLWQGKFNISYGNKIPYLQQNIFYTTMKVTFQIKRK